MPIPMILAGAAAGLSALGGIGSYFTHAAAARQAGQYAKYTKLLADAQAKWQEQQAGQELAAGQQQAIGIGRQGQALLSRGQALAAASGADLSSPSIVTNMADLARNVDLAKQAALYNSQSQAQALNYQAMIGRLTGQQQATTMRSQAALEKYQGVTGLFGLPQQMAQPFNSPLFIKYGMGGP